MATKEADIRGGYANLCDCCDSPNCGKKGGPYAKKHKPYLEGQKKRVSWRGPDCPNGYNNDYIMKIEKSRKVEKKS